MKTYLFPGQGSQRKGMGEGLFDEFPDLTKKADKILGYSIKDLCLNDPDHKLNQTQYTQPALYVVNALSYQKKIKEGAAQPDFLAGHSLGEYNALLAAGAIGFEDGLKLVKKRGELMSQAKNGAMAAILNSSEKQIREIFAEANVDTIDIANLNSPYQIVISGLKDDVSNAQPFFEKANAMFIPLNTSGAFHSRYMKDAEKEYEKLVKKTKFSKPNIVVMANVTGKPYAAAETAQNLTNQLSNCVRWNESMTYLMEQGDMEFEELGVGDVLTKLIASIKRSLATEAKSASEKTESKAVPAVENVATANNTKEDVRVEKKSAAAKDGSDPIKLVEQWNKKHRVGTKVTSDFYDNELETRTEAMILFGHRAAVYMKGYNGYFDLREVKAVQ